MKFCPLCGKELLEKEIDGINRKACSTKTCTFVHWDNPTPVVAAIVELDGNVIMIRNKGWPENMFGIVSGFLEKGETADDAILREVKEELGLDGRIQSFIGYYTFPEMNQLLLTFHIVAQGKIVIGDELEEIRVVEPERIRPWGFGTGPAVKKWLEMRAASE
jgi:NAD+ diphosphatase